MSEPCPPAFIRTAPPIEPGTPTAHSKPRQPGGGSAAGERPAARRHRRRATARRSPSTARRSRRPASATLTAMPGNRRRRRAGSSPGRRRAPAAPTPPRAAADGGQVVEVRGRASSAAGPPTRYVVSGPSGASRTAIGPSSRRPPPRRPAIGEARRRHGDLRVAAPGHDLLGQRGDVAAAHRDAHVTRADLAGEERHHVVAPGQPDDPGIGVGVEHGVDDQLAGDAGDRRRARRVDVGDHDDVGADEGVGVVAPHLGDAVEPVGLERPR